MTVSKILTTPLPLLINRVDDDTNFFFCFFDISFQLDGFCGGGRDWAGVSEVGEWCAIS